MSKSGPEDSLAAVPQPNTSGLVTAGPDWLAVRAPRPPTAPALDFPDEGDFARLRRLAGAYDGAAGAGAGAGAVIRDLDVARKVCAKPRFNMEVRRRVVRRGERLAHAAPFSCARQLTVRHINDPPPLPLNMQLCVRDRKAHQAKNCLPTMLEVEKCRIKLCVGGRL